MNRIITVSGTGSASQTPDTVELNMQLKTLDNKHSKAMERMAELLKMLGDSIKEAGFEEMKTSSLRVNTKYENVRDAQGNYTNVFRGYECFVDTKLSFGFDTKRIADALEAVDKSGTNPTFSIEFTVEDKNAMEDAALEDAVARARQKAELLAKASGVKLGEIVAIRHSFNTVRVYSETSFDMGSDMLMNARAMSNMEMSPEDIDINADVTIDFEMI